MSILKYQEILNAARDRVDAGKMKAVLSVALAIALSRKVQLPSTAALDGFNYYMDTASPQILSEAAQFNENLLVDLDLVEQTARAFWLMRYHAAYPTKVIPLTSDEEGHFLGRLNGTGHLINPATFELLQANSVAVILLINRIRALEGDDEVVEEAGSDLAL